MKLQRDRMKSLLMSMGLLSVALGNQIPSIISFLIPKLKSMGMNLEGANYFRFFTLLMQVTSIIYVFVSRHYKERTYLQSQEPDEIAIEPLLAGRDTDVATARAWRVIPSREDGRGISPKVLGTLLDQRVSDRAVVGSLGRRRSSG